MKKDDVRVPGPKDIEVLGHNRPHLSDILAAYLIRRYGGEKYGRGAAIPGRRVVMIGRGGYDEHSDPKLAECEATLVAKDLGINEKFELKFILEYTLKVDRFGQGKGVLKFGRLVELMHDVYSDHPERVTQWTEVMIQAAIEAAGRPRETVDSELVLGFISQARAIVEGEFSPFVMAKLGEVLKSFSPRAPFQEFSLPHCVELLWRMFRRLPNRPTPVQWAADALRAELVRQREFLAAEQDLAAVLTADVVVSGKPVFVLVGRSDNQRFHSFVFSKYENAVVVAVRRSSGNIQVFRRNRAPVNVELWSACAQLREMELESRGRKVPVWDDLVSQTGPEGARHVFFQHATQFVLNGSLTTPAEPVRVTDVELVEILVRALDDKHLAWRREFYLSHGGPVG